MVNSQYRINDKRLEIKYYDYKKKDFLWMKIPYKKEVNALLRYIHYNNKHLKKEGMSKKIIVSGFFWAGYTKDIKNFIKTCGVCHSLNNI